MLDINALLTRQRDYFYAGATLKLQARQSALSSLYNAIKNNESTLLEALHADLGKSPVEAFVTELGMVYAEIKHFRKHLPAWTKTASPFTPFSLWPGKSRIHLEPLGQVLILAPWNYPLQLNLTPLVVALAAGNTAVIKPSGSAPACALALEKLVAEALPPELALVLNGGHNLADNLLALPFDFIFYTGSARIGRKVMAAAAANLTPVCLELGGKSPVLVMEDANIDLAARRIAWGKLLNAGQTCTSPDYVLAHPAIKDELVAGLRRCFAQFAPNAPNNSGYPRMVNEKAFNRLLAIAPQAQTNRATLKIAPTVMDEISPEHPAMAEEIFGPLLPVLSFDALPRADSGKLPIMPQDLPGLAIHYVRHRPKPLALYLFTRSKEMERRVLEQISFGGGCVNDTLLHLVVPGLPFGGVGESGMGRYHGRAGLEMMSNKKSVLSRGAFDFSLRYPPWPPSALNFFRRFLR